jgi:hypothetical protein
MPDTETAAAQEHVSEVPEKRADSERISLGDSIQVHTWAHRLGTTPEHLRQLIARVGPRVSDLAAELSRPETMD